MKAEHFIRNKRRQFQNPTTLTSVCVKIIRISIFKEEGIFLLQNAWRLENVRKFVYRKRISNYEKQQRRIQTSLNKWRNRRNPFADNFQKFTYFNRNKNVLVFPSTFVYISNDKDWLIKKKFPFHPTQKNCKKNIPL